MNNLTDQQIDEYSARAIGLDVVWLPERGRPAPSGWYVETTDRQNYDRRDYSLNGKMYKRWNPKHDDTDSGRLVDGLDMTIFICGFCVIVSKKHKGETLRCVANFSDHANNKRTARLYAVAYVAALWWLRMQEGKS